MKATKMLGVMIYAKDMAAMTAFYRDVMGFSVSKDDGGWVELDAGGSLLALHAIPEQVAATIAIETPPVPREETPLKLLFAVDDLEALRERLRAAGAYRAAPNASAASAVRVDGVDPEGNIFSVLPGA